MLTLGCVWWGASSAHFNWWWGPLTYLGNVGKCLARLWGRNWVPYRTGPVIRYANVEVISCLGFIKFTSHCHCRMEA
jgi:hypothetical protein